MARFNSVRLQGEITRVVDRREVNGHVLAELSVKRVKSERIDRPVILTEDEEGMASLLYAKKLIEEGKRVSVFVRGSVETYDTNLNLECTKCKIPFKRSVVRMFVRVGKPTIIEGNDVPHFNEAYVLGTLVTDVQHNIATTGAPRSTYKIALNGKAGSANYPHVVSFHEQAISDKMRMHSHSQCFVYGFFQTRDVNIGCTCPVCQTKQPRSIQTSEILALNVEYLDNCNFEETEIEEQKKFVEKAITEAREQDLPEDHPNRRKEQNGNLSPLEQVSQNLKPNS